MFGEPVKVKDRSNIFFLVWTYNIKDVNGQKKARCACDGSSRGGRVRILDYTHANCIDHVASRIFYGVAAAENMQVWGADVGNAFAEAPPPKQGFYIQPDRAFKEWWTARGHKPIADDEVIPVMRAMQGHPESPRLWEKHCDGLIREMGFVPTVHEPCLYLGEIDGERCIFKRQVDDFAIAMANLQTAHKLFDMFDDKLTMPMKRLGLVNLFNGVDVLQSRYFIKLSCQTYIETMSNKYINTWMKDLRDMANRPMPFPTTESFTKNFNNTVGTDDMKELEKLKNEFGFGYRNGIGELIYAMVTCCRPDLSTTVVRCAQHSAKPSKFHFHAVRHALKYLYVTRNDGIYFWRPKPLMELPEHDLPSHSLAYHGVLPEQAQRPEFGPLEAHGYTDSDWATCPNTRRSLTGIGVKFAGGIIAYKTKLQPTIALSSTEAEFMAACDAGKMMLFIRSILWDLNIPQKAASVLYEDNDACTAMANAQKPTMRTRHMDIRYFALSDWVERDLIILERIHTAINEADHFTKILDRTLFYRHTDYLMGRIPPAYSPCFEKMTHTSVPATNIEISREEMGTGSIAARAAKCMFDKDTWIWVYILAHDGAVVQSNPVYLSLLGLWGGVSSR
jgi:hypothetical protein